MARVSSRKGPHETLRTGSPPRWCGESPGTRTHWVYGPTYLQVTLPHSPVQWPRPHPREQEQLSPHTPCSSLEPFGNRNRRRDRCRVSTGKVAQMPPEQRDRRETCVSTPSQLPLCMSHSQPLGTEAAEQDRQASALPSSFTLVLSPQTTSDPDVTKPDLGFGLIL